jgi:hypothetical protein
MTPTQAPGCEPEVFCCLVGEREGWGGTAGVHGSGTGMGLVERPDVLATGMVYKLRLWMMTVSQVVNTVAQSLVYNTTQSCRYWLAQVLTRSMWCCPPHSGRTCGTCHCSTAGRWGHSPAAWLCHRDKQHHEPSWPKAMLIVVPWQEQSEPALSTSSCQLTDCNVVFHPHALYVCLMPAPSLCIQLCVGAAGQNEAMQLDEPIWWTCWV